MVKSLDMFRPGRESDRDIHRALENKRLLTAGQISINTKKLCPAFPKKKQEVNEYIFIERERERKRSTPCLAAKGSHYLRSLATTKD